MITIIIMTFIIIISIKIIVSIIIIITIIVIFPVITLSFHKSDRQQNFSISLFYQNLQISDRIK